MSRCELALTLGDVSGAVTDAENSVTYAERSGDAFQRMVNRTTHADALHQSGRWSDADSLFREAEQMQAERQPDYPLLYSLRGFRYCDLLLAPVEREAWKVAFRSAKVARDDEHYFRGAKGDNFEICSAVMDRANKSLEIVLKGSRSLLDIALDHLTLSRAALYELLLHGTGPESFSADAP